MTKPPWRCLWVLLAVGTACPAPFDPVEEGLFPPPCSKDEDCAADIIGPEWGERHCEFRTAETGQCVPGAPTPSTDAGASAADSGSSAVDSGGGTPDGSSSPEPEAGVGDGGVVDGGDAGTVTPPDAGDRRCSGVICPQGEACREGVCEDIVCGDGRVEGDETCDDGNQNNNDACPDDSANAGTCEAARCGDGLVHNQAGGSEECDDGNLIETDGCTRECERTCSPLCGEDEVCLPDGDDLRCRPIECGDGRQDPGEECDEGQNNDNGGACLENCRSAQCGDGHLHVGTEACDDNNVTDGDGCSGICQIEEGCNPACNQDQICREGQCEAIECGNGHVEEGEQCDDGNDINTDACIEGCLRASCGDGHLQADSDEECDDGDNNSDDAPNACRVDCTHPSCGDEIIDDGEQCDDGNQIGDDGCSATCQGEGSTICDLFRDGVFTICGDCHTGNSPSGGLNMDMTNAATFFNSLNSHQNRFMLPLIGLDQGDGNHLRSYVYRKLSNSQGTVQINKAVTCSNNPERVCQNDADCEAGGQCQGICEDPNNVPGPPTICTPNGGECVAPETCRQLACSVTFAICENDADCGNDGGNCQGFCNRSLDCTPGGDECLAVETCNNLFCDNNFNACNADADCGGGNCVGSCMRDLSCSPDDNDCLASEICAGGGPMDCGDLCGASMPRGGPNLTAESLTRVQQWLELPAAQNGPFACTDRETCQEENDCGIGEICEAGLCKLP